MSKPLDGHVIRSLVESYEKHETKRRDAQDAQKRVLEDAEARGINPKMLKRFIQNQRRDPDEVRAETSAYEAIAAAYRNFDKTPLGAAAAKRDAERAFGETPAQTTVEINEDTGDVTVEGEGKLADAVRGEIAKGRKARGHNQPAETVN